MAVSQLFLQLSNLALAVPQLLLCCGLLLLSGFKASLAGCHLGLQQGKLALCFSQEALQLTDPRLSIAQGKATGLHTVLSHLHGFLQQQRTAGQVLLGLG